MANVHILANCGCGYKTKRLEEAVVHSDTTGHRMDIFGSVRSDKPIDVPTAEIAQLPTFGDDAQAKLAALRKSISNE